MLPSCSAVRRGALIALAAGALLAACGNGSGSQAKSSPVATNDTSPDREREPRGAAEVDRALRPARLRHLRAGRREAPVRRRAGGPHPRPAGGKHEHVPRHPLAGHVGRRAGPAVDRVRARLRAIGPVLRLLHRQVPGRARRRVQARERRPAPTPARERLVLRMDDPEANHNGGLLLFGPDKHCTSAPATAAAPATSTARAATRRTSARRSASSCGSTRSSRAARPTRCPPTTRS